MEMHNYAIAGRVQVKSKRRAPARLLFGPVFSLILPVGSSRVRIARGRPSETGHGRISFHREGIFMAGDNIPLTQARAEAIKREIKRLKSVERPKNVAEISTARDHGDLRENAEYHASKEKQSHIEGRILMLEDRLARAEIIDVRKLSGKRVVFG